MTYTPLRSAPLSPIRLITPSTRMIPPTPTSPDLSSSSSSGNVPEPSKVETTRSHHRPVGTDSRQPRPPPSTKVKAKSTIMDIYQRNLGLIYIIIAQLFFSLMGISVKFLISSTSISTLTLILVRMSITLFFCILSLYLMNVSHPFLGPPGYRTLLCFRGFFGFTGLFATYASLRGLTVSDSVTISFLVPSFAALLGYIWLNESVSRKEMIAGALSLGGVVMISRPSFLFGKMRLDDSVETVGTAAADSGGGNDGEGDDVLRLESVAWALSGVISTAIAYTVIRRIGDKAHALHSIGYFAFFCTISSGIALIVLPGPIAWPSTPLGFALIGVIGVFGFCAQAFLTMGLMREKAGRAGLGIYLQVLFSITFEYIVFQTVPSILSIVGTGIILASALWVALSKESIGKRVVDEENQPISRSPSPAPREGTTIRGGHYDYSSVPSGDPEVFDTLSETLSPQTLPSQTRRPSLGVTSGSGGHEGRRRTSGTSVT